MEINGSQLVRDVVYSPDGLVKHLAAQVRKTLAKHARTKHLNGMELNIFQLVKGVENRHVGKRVLDVEHLIRLVTKLVARTNQVGGIGIVTNFEGVDTIGFFVLFQFSKILPS